MKPKLSTDRVTLNSAAIQDHIMQKFNLYPVTNKIPTYKKPNYSKKSSFSSVG